MTRIVGGIAGGRRLAVPARGTRPTSDRVREALFSSLEHEVGTWEGLHVLDLYAGSGALGLEAASRGAAVVVLVESARPAIEVIRRNIESLGLPGVRLVPGSVLAALRSGPVEPVGLALLDPPYDLAGADLAVALAALVPWLLDDALVVVERRAGDPVPWPEGLEPLRERAYGDTAVHLARRVGLSGRAPGPDLRG